MIVQNGQSLYESVDLIIYDLSTDKKPLEKAQKEHKKNLNENKCRNLVPTDVVTYYFRVEDTAMR